jgi:hypothetical protein
MWNGLVLYVVLKDVSGFGILFMIFFSLKCIDKDEELLNALLKGLMDKSDRVLTRIVFLLSEVYLRNVNNLTH